MISEYSDILTVKDVAEILYIGRNTVYTLLNNGELPGFRLGNTWKISRDALADFIIEKSKRQIP